MKSVSPNTNYLKYLTYLAYALLPCYENNCYEALIQRGKLSKNRRALLKCKTIGSAGCLLTQLCGSVHQHAYGLSYHINNSNSIGTNEIKTKYYPASFPQTSQNSSSLLNCPESICWSTQGCSETSCDQKSTTPSCLGICFICGPSYSLSSQNI